MHRNDYIALAIAATLILAFWTALIIYYEVVIA